ncbi:MAG: ATPase, partial [Micromonosporaceae bacterium]
LTSDTALAVEVRRRAAEHWPGSHVGTALDGAAAAAWLAASELPDEAVDAEATHTRLLDRSTSD